MAWASSPATSGPVRMKAAGARGTMAGGKGLSSSNIQKVPTCRTPVSEGSVMPVIPPYKSRCRLYPEEHVPDLVNDLWIAAGLSTRETLEGCEHEIRGVFE